MRVKDVRVVLERNKIFFEVLGSMAVIFIAYKANEISEHQMNLNKKIAQPSFKIETEYPDQGLNIKLFNEGGPYSDLQMLFSSTVDITFIKSDGNPRKFSAELGFKENFRPKKNPVISKFYKFPVIITKEDPSFKSLEGSLSRFTKKNGKVEMSYAYLRHYLKLSYLDFNNEPKIRYYRINRGDYQQITKEKGKAIFNEPFNKIHYFRGITPYVFDSIVERNVQ